MGPHRLLAPLDPFFTEPAVATAIDSLGASLRARDINTYAHSSRLIPYASKIGEVLSLSPDRLHILQCGALLHDIGKLVVHEQILSKPAPLSDPEWSVMRQHPASGYRIAAAASVPDAIARISLTHHEWYDGSGYPLGLKGKRISLEARICALVDVLDALTSTRSYRQPISFTEAALAIQAERGTHFDPLVVDAFLSVPVEVWVGLRPADALPSPTARDTIFDRFDKPNTKVIRSAGAHPPHFSDPVPHHVPSSAVHCSF
ncbi:MAG: HD-GYP domain-containing protein [Nitrospirae bacterium]|nr:MAG: HD-GYP domain-containing protein [Nitrospirota bacterium]